MNASPKGTALVPGASLSAEQRLKELSMNLPAPPEPLGAYVEAVLAGNLLFLSGVLPTEGRVAKFVGSPCRLGYGVASLRLGAPVELEVIIEVAG